jgi:hypothetical protein
VFIAIVAVAGTTLAIGAFLNSDSNSRAVGAAQANTAQTSTQTTAPTSEDMEVTTMVETFDLPGQPTGVHALPMLASLMFSDTQFNWGVRAGVGVGGSNAFDGDFSEPSSNAAAVPLTLPTRLDFAGLEPGESIDYSFDTQLCRSAQARCNEAYIGLIDPDAIINDVQSAWTNALRIGLAVNPNIIRVMLLENVENQAHCEQIGGGYVAQPLANGQIEQRCFHIPNTTPSPWTPPDMQYFKLAAHFVVQDGNLIVSVTGNGNPIASNINLGSLSLRSWWGNGRPAFFVDTLADNMQIQQTISRPTPPPIVVETDTCYDEE